MKMKSLLLGGLMALSGNAHSLTCDNQATGLQLQIPSFDTGGDDWAQCMINAFLTLNASSTLNGATSSATLHTLWISTLSGLNGQDIWISSPVSLGSGNQLNLYGSAGYIITQSSISASGFFGDGSGITGITASGLSDGSVTTSKIGGGAVTNTAILDGAVTTNALGGGAVVTSKLLDGAVTTAKLGDGAVTTSKLGNESVFSKHISPFTITEFDLANNSVWEASVIDGAITTTKIADGAVTTSKLNSGSVTESKILAGAVTSTKIQDGSLNYAKLAGDFTFGKINIEKTTNVTGLNVVGNSGGPSLVVLDNVYNAANDGAVNITGGGVTSGVVLDVFAPALVTGIAMVMESSSTAMTDAVILRAEATASGTLANYTANTMDVLVNRTDTRTTGTGTHNYDGMRVSRTEAHNGAGGTTATSGAILKLESTVTETAGTITSNAVGLEINHKSRHASDIAALDITSANDGAGSPVAINIASGSGDVVCVGCIPTASIADGLITTSKLGEGVITSGKIGDSEITTSKLRSGAVASATILDGAVTTPKLASGSVTSLAIFDGSVTTTKISHGAVSREMIQDDAVTTPKLASGSVFRRHLRFDCSAGQVIKWDGSNAYCAADDTGGASGGGWLDAGTTISPETGTDRVSIGAAVPVASATLHVQGSVSITGDLEANKYTNSLATDIFMKAPGLTLSNFGTSLASMTVQGDSGLNKTVLSGYKTNNPELVIGDHATDKGRVTMYAEGEVSMGLGANGFFSGGTGKYEGYMPSVSRWFLEMEGGLGSGALGGLDQFRIVHSTPSTAFSPTVGVPIADMYVPMWINYDNQVMFSRKRGGENPDTAASFSVGVSSFVIREDGNIGVGIQQPTTAKFEIRANVDVGAAVALKVSSPTAGNPIFVVENDGSVGINTVPQAGVIFHVIDSVETTAKLKYGGVAQPVDMMYRDFDGVGCTRCQPNNGTFTCISDADCEF